MQNSKIKLRIEKFLPIMLCRFSNDIFALKKCRIQRFENLTSKKIRVSSFNKYSAT